MGILQIIPLWIVSAVWAGLLVATICLYRFEIKAAWVWVLNIRQRKHRSIAQHLYDIQQEELVSAAADAILRLTPVRQKEIDELIKSFPSKDRQEDDS